VDGLPAGELRITDEENGARCRWIRAVGSLKRKNVPLERVGGGLRRLAGTCHKTDCGGGKENEQRLNQYRCAGKGFHD